MSITGNVIDVQKIQLTDTFQTWFSKTNELIDTINPVNIYDIDDGNGTEVSFGISGTDYNGVKYVNVVSGYGVSVKEAGSGHPWAAKVALDLSGISGEAYTLTGNPDYTLTGDAQRNSEVNKDDLFLVLDRSDTTQGLSGTTKLVPAKYMIPRELYMPTLDFYGDFSVKGNLYAVGANSTSVGSLSIGSKYVYLAATGSGETGGAYHTEATLGESGIVVSLTGPDRLREKSLIWRYNSGNSYWAFNEEYGAIEPNSALVNSKFIARNFVGGGSTANTFVFEADASQPTTLLLTQLNSSPYFGIVKAASSSNVSLNVYNGAGITSVANIIAGTTSQYPGVTARAFIQFANVDMVDGAHAVTGASAWTIPVGDSLGELRPDRHNAGQIKRRFLQNSHGLTTGEAVTVVPNGAAYSTSLWGTLTAADAGSSLLEAIGIVDRVISANEVSVTMKGYVELSANKLKGIGTPVTGQYYLLDWARKGSLTSNTNTPQGKVYQPLFLALNGSAGLVYGNEGETIFPSATDEVYMRGMIPIGMIQPYAGNLAGLTMSLSGGSIPVSDVQYNSNYLPCDGRAVPTNSEDGFFDLFNLLGYSYPMRGVVISSNNETGIRIRPDRGTSNLSLITFPSSGTFRAIRRSGTNAVHQEYSVTYTSLTADSSTITINATGLQTLNTTLGSGIIVDILTPQSGEYFFLPDMRGKSPFGQYDRLGEIGQAFNLGETGGASVQGQTGATSSGNGGLYTNYIIRAKREADALILTGHNHDSRYLRKDVNDTATVGTTLNLQNLAVLGQINPNIGIGRLAVADTSSNASPVSWEKSGNYATWMRGFNTNTGTNASVGYLLNNGVGQAAFYALGRNAGNDLVLSSDHGLSGILISAAGITGETFRIQDGRGAVIRFNDAEPGTTSGVIKSFVKPNTSDSNGVMTELYNGTFFVSKQTGDPLFFVAVGDTQVTKGNFSVLDAAATSTFEGEVITKKRLKAQELITASKGLTITGGTIIVESTVPDVLFTNPQTRFSGAANNVVRFDNLTYAKQLQLDSPTQAFPALRVTGNALYLGGTVDLIAKNTATDRIRIGIGDTPTSSNYLDIEQGWRGREGYWIANSQNQSQIDWLGTTGGVVNFNTRNNGVAAAYSCTPTIYFDSIPSKSPRKGGLIGMYDPSDTQQIFAMGTSYVLPARHGYTSGEYGSFYGLAWSYNPGWNDTYGYGFSGQANTNPQSKSGLSHQLLLMANGKTWTAMGYGIWTIGGCEVNAWSNGKVAPTYISTAAPASAASMPVAGSVWYVV